MCRIVDWWGVVRVFVCFFLGGEVVGWGVLEDWFGLVFILVFVILFWDDESEGFDFFVLCLLFFCLVVFV